MPAARRAVVVLVGVLALAACSNSSTVAAKRPRTGTGTATAASNGVQVVTVTTGNDYRFHPSTIVVHSGRVRIVLHNTAKPGQGAPHDLVVTGLPGQPGTGLASAGQTLDWEFVAPAPGKYRFVCTIHVEQGQTGTLIVR